MKEVTNLKKIIYKICCDISLRGYADNLMLISKAMSDKDFYLSLMNRCPNLLKNDEYIIDKSIINVYEAKLLYNNEEEFIDIYYCKELNIDNRDIYNFILKVNKMDITTRQIISIKDNYLLNKLKNNEYEHYLFYNYFVTDTMFVLSLINYILGKENINE